MLFPEVSHLTRLKRSSSPIQVFDLFFFFNLFIFYLIYFLAALGFRCCARASSSCGEQRLLFIVVHGLPIVVASPAAEHGL